MPSSTQRPNKENLIMNIITQIQTLSKREKQIAMKIMDGSPNKIIASDLFISERTVKFHCANIYRKLNISNRTTLIARYYKELYDMAS
ncbi:MAG: helix-turn-helix transcriptional regulator [Glaciecola sp.]